MLEGDKVFPVIFSPILLTARCRESSPGSSALKALSYVAIPAVELGREVPGGPSWAEISFRDLWSSQRKLYSVHYFYFTLITEDPRKAADLRKWEVYVEEETGPRQFKTYLRPIQKYIGSQCR